MRDLGILSLCLNAHSTVLWGSTVDGLVLSTLSQAISLTDQAALAGVARWEWLPLAAYEQSLSLRAYSTGLIPYARAIGAPSLTEGKRPEMN